MDFIAPLTPVHSENYMKPLSLEGHRYIPVKSAFFTLEVLDSHSVTFFSFGFASGKTAT